MYIYKYHSSNNQNGESARTNYCSLMKFLEFRLYHANDI
jgi:hypothetical protein